MKNRIHEKKDKVKKVKSKKARVIKIVALSLLAAFFLFNAFDIIINVSYKKLPDKPDESIETNKINDLLYYLDNPDRADEDNIVIDNEYVIDSVTPVKKYIDERWDCSDFNMHSALRIQYLYGDEIAEISPEGSELIKEMYLNAKYWMTEPGEDSICFWSENHQLLFAVAEYLAGYEWQDEVFTNDGTTGLEHMQRARDKINYWMEHRFYYGFAEFNSTNYAQFNIAPMANFIQFAASEDNEMVEKMKIVLDLQLFDLASNSYKHTFMAPSGRSYAKNKVGISGDRMRKYTDYIWKLNDDWKNHRHRMLLNFISMMEGENEYGEPYYEIPEVILEIGRDTQDKVIKSSSGLDVSEIAEKGYVGHSDEQIMMQLGMEAFTNPEVIKNTITYLAENNMLNNKFVNDFKYFNISLFKIPGVLEFITEKFNPMPNGIAIQRANIYTYKTPDYQLATAQAYHPGSYGAQQMLSITNFTEKAVVFTQHPARFASVKNADASPGYWTGFGRAPHSVQHKNIQMSIYQLPEKSGFLELYDVPKFTHTYLPEAYFDEVIIDGKHAFARVGDAFLSLTGKSELEYLEHDEDIAAVFGNDLEQYPDKRFDLVQEGLNQFWIYELSDSSKETFADFKSRIKGNTIDFNGKDNLQYTSEDNTYDLTFNGNFKINDSVQNLDYKRFDSEYITAEREAEEFNFSFNGYELTVNYENVERRYN